MVHQRRLALHSSAAGVVRAAGSLRTFLRPKVTASSMRKSWNPSFHALDTSGSFCGVMGNLQF
eukprot:6321680-Karenia_brevis.AAC.1